MEKKKPKAIKPGACFGIVAPSSPAPDIADLDACEARLLSMGYTYKEGEACRKVYGFLAGDDGVRAEDLNRFFLDGDVDAIWCMRGGYGAMRLLPLLDYEAAAAHPKPLIGFSDITALHTAYGQRSGLVTYHAPMPLGNLAKGPMDDCSRRAFDAVLCSPEPFDVPSAYPLWAVRPGVAEGVLVGGNLSLLTGMMGTPWELDTRGKLLFLEEVGEDTYCVDRMLVQLRLAGKLEACAGVVLGDFTDCAGGRNGLNLPLAQVLRDQLGSLDKPVLGGFSIGHCHPNGTLAFGIRCRLDADAMTLRSLEAGVSG